MIVSTLLLDLDDNYLCNDKLPSPRPTYDKKLLSAFIEFGSVSQGGLELLPPSLKQVATVTHGEPQTPLTIPEINYLSDILIVSRSRSHGINGKKFRFDRFERILLQGQIEIWKRKTT